LPLTGNGKVDRSQLSRASVPAPGRAAGRPGAPAAPATDLERQVAELWAGILHCPVAELDLDRNFYAAAGDSLAAARVLTGVRKQFGVGITLDRFFEVDTIRALAAYVEAAVGAARP